jgi:phosphoribosylglycinamide formyltransferase 2
VILADRHSRDFRFEGVAQALARPGTDIRLFGKPDTRPGRRMGVALATADSIADARAAATAAAAAVTIAYADA